MKKVGTIIIVLALAACATSPDTIAPTYISPLQYRDYNCNQIIMEMNHTSKRASELYMRLDKKAGNDKAQAWIGALLFWPTLFALEGGDGTGAVQYANLKGEFEALRSASVQKECNVVGIKSPEEIVLERAEEEKKQLKKEQLNKGSYGSK